MQFEKAKSEHEQWKRENPGVTCDHPGPFQKEYYLGSQSTDRVCMACYEALPPDVAKAALERQKAQQ